MTLGLIGVSFSLPEWLSFKTGFLCTLGLQLLKTHFYSLSHVPLPLEDITFLTVRQLSAQGHGFVYLFVHLFASGFKGSTGGGVQEKSTEDKLTQVRFVAFFLCCSVRVSFLIIIIIIFTPLCNNIFTIVKFLITNI